MRRVRGRTEEAGRQPRLLDPAPPCWLLNGIEWYTGLEGVSNWLAIASNCEEGELCGPTAANY